jgi:hypothetical protein
MDNEIQSITPKNIVDAEPTKTFFMSMLTRDIALSDAILDLVDNCIDGVHRTKKDMQEDSGSFYSDFFCEITIDKNQFTLKDNCGGIPLDVAKNYAFKLGRDNQGSVDKDLETVGMYGIGMKRAIFKIGTEAEVISHHRDDTFKVTIPSNWVGVKGWYFEYSLLKEDEIKDIIKENGTLIKVTNIHPEISSQFGNESVFIKDLSVKIRQHYGYIIQQGFKIILNKEVISSLDLNILTDKGNNKKAIRPYIYTNKFDDIDVEIIIGFYRPPATQEELDDELVGEYAPSESNNAGITVICNDRIVLYCDKTYTTGWGDTPIPKYHTQFIGITGVVHFKSKNPISLPVTTTKRGLNESSAIYRSIKEKIKDGLKIYTSFTNNWKTPSPERITIFADTVKFNALAPGHTKSNLVSLAPLKNDKDGTALYQIPDLPKPTKIEKTDVTISFKREKIEVEAIRSYFFDGAKKSAGEIGAWCFDKIYAQVD